MRKLRASLKIESNTVRWLKGIGHRFRDEKGFGLAESLVAVALLGTAVISLTVALSTGSLGVSALRENVTAQSLAQSQLAYAKSYPYDIGTTTYPSVASYHPTHNPNPVTLPEGYAITVDVSNTQDSDSDIQKIKATISKDSETLLEVEDFKVNR